MIAWCAGTFASGSTWTYNVMRAILPLLQPGRPVQGRFANVLDDLAGLDDARSEHVVKSHDMQADAGAELRRRAERIVVTIRDPRDAVASLMTYQRYPFDIGLQTVAKSARFVAGLADDPRSLLLRYESGFIDDPATIDRLAEALGGRLAPGQRDALFEQSRRGAIERLIGGLEALPTASRDPGSGDIFDPQTQWHAHHAGRSGEVGRWRRRLMLGQVAAVERELADWMARFGYAAEPQFTAGYSVRLSG